MMELYFVLDERGEPRHESDLEVWMHWFEQADLGVARTIVSPDVIVLTTFRGVDDSPELGKAPLLFETRVFGGILDGEEGQYPIRAEAVEGHATLVEWCRVAKTPNYGVHEENLD